MLLFIGTRPSSYTLGAASTPPRREKGVGRKGDEKSLQYSVRTRSSLGARRYARGGEGGVHVSVTTQDHSSLKSRCQYERTLQKGIGGGGAGGGGSFWLT